MSKTKNHNNNNCCKNCACADGYTGFDDFYCSAFKCWIRAEHYNCKHFKTYKERQ